MLHEAAASRGEALLHLKLQPIEALPITVRALLAKLRSLVCLSLARASAAVAWQSGGVLRLGHCTLVCREDDIRE